MTTTSTLPTAAPRTTAGLALRAGLWIAQGLLAFVYLWAASMKLGKSPAELAGVIPWAAQSSEAFVRAIGLVDLAAGLGILLPALTRIAPRLTVAAALGASALQVCAMAFHLSRGEAAVLPFNLVLLALSLFVAWGRARKAPIAARG
ncbi:DoxX family protein [Mitsuaria sp. WAJ17]|uniref:DoxX family protein n=1 Tax=Mitsuaria sp. WAJ17 TaxID=2761452 RepID=UPI001603706A|nr:DoxX family protein [Mitsuaria sp. WAJ17]MBB2487508.1 DoxX family protein [Mitsuaria sp. WAJ17]